CDFVVRSFAGSVMFVFGAIYFLLHGTATIDFYALSLHDALPISVQRVRRLECLPAPEARAEPPRLVVGRVRARRDLAVALLARRSEEHTSELQSRRDLVCRLLLENKNKLHSIAIHYD